MTSKEKGVFLTCFEELEDPRMNCRKKHDLLDIIAIAVFAVIAGADGWTDVEIFGKSKEQWPRAAPQAPQRHPSP